MRDPSVFLMDEPLSNLDAKLRVQMRSEIKKLHKRLQTTFIYVTHDQVEAMTMGDRIVILNNGIIQQIDTPDNVYNQPQNMFVASFIGSPAMNFIDTKIISDNELIIHDQTIKFGQEIINTVKNNNLVNKNVILGIRPEHFSTTGENSIKITPDLVEMLGSEKLIHFTIDNKSLTAKASPDFNATAGQETILNINISKIMLFNPETQELYRC